MSGFVGGIGSKSGQVGQLNRVQYSEGLSLTNTGVLVSGTKGAGAGLVGPWNKQQTLLDCSNLDGKPTYVGVATDTLNGTPTTKVALTRGNIHSISSFYAASYQTQSYYNGGDSGGQSGQGLHGQHRSGYDATIGTCVTGQTSHGVNNTDNGQPWFGLHHGGNYDTEDIWYIWDMQADRPSVRITKAVYRITWGGGNVNFEIWGTHKKPQPHTPRGQGDALKPTFNAEYIAAGEWTRVVLKVMEAVGSAVTVDTGYQETSADNYRYYCFRLQTIGASYDYGLDTMKIYGDYY